MRDQHPIKADSKSAKFKVAMKLPEQWKMKAISDFKARRKGLADPTVPKNRTISSNISTATTVSTASSSSSSRKVGDTGNKGTADVNKEASSLSRPTLVERSVKELEYWNTRSIVAKERIASLHSVKNSLLWLLKKAALHERSLINDYPPNPSI